MSQDNSSQSALLAHLRHELRTPINAIIGYSEMLLEELDSKADRSIRNELTNILSCGRELLSLVNTILAPTHLNDIDLSAFYEAIQVELEIHLKIAIASCQELGKTVWPGLLADVNKIHSSILSLMKTIETMGEWSKQLPKTLDSELPTDIAVSSLNSFDSEDISKLSISETKQNTKEKETVANFQNTSKSERSAKILLVDDSELNRDLLSRQIESLGYLIATASNVEQAIEAIETGAYDLLLLDVIMPKMNGYQVLEKLRNSDWRHIPVIMISALDEIESVVKCIEMGAEDYLPKSFNPTLLRARLNACLEKKQLRDREVNYLSQLAGANEEITKLNQCLQAENLRLNAELEITRRLQQMMLPKEEELQKITELEIAGFMQPAEEVGGDYYDVLQEGDRITIGIGDVTGHGLESGVLTIVAQTAIRTLLENGQSDPQIILQILNRTVYKNLQRMGSTKNMTLAILDYHQGKLTLSGQHEEAIVIRWDGKIQTFDTIDLGFPIGLQEDIAEFVCRTEIQLNWGDLVVLYTDGVTEAENSEGEHYGLTRLCQVVQKNRSRSAEQIRQLAIDDLRQYIGQQKIYDDITLLILKQK
ncbi:MAG: SpoIIE family protein phosphatase [Xenococcaceae cyanobacterium]